MKKLCIAVAILFILLLKTALPVYAVDDLKIEIPPVACGGNERDSCPPAVKDIYRQITPIPGQAQDECAESLDDFKLHPESKHFWVEDPKVTAQGKADERARQFIYWVINSEAVDNSPILKSVWNITSGVTYLLAIIIVAIMGLGYIIGQRVNFQLKLQIWPTILKILGMFVYIFFSALIVISVIQLSDLSMKFFIDKLGGHDLFNIYFSTPDGSSETNYTTFIGCRDLNIRVQEAADTEVFLFKITNITYYAMGIMLILRKILLWFMLFVAPFLSLLMTFVFIRNVGWIWIGVFFQWLFYGPLFAIFLGGLNVLWQAGIPFKFDFSRVGKITGYIFPTALGITYGGPAQRGEQMAIGALNNGSYIDTFAEYVITLIMLWAVIVFPWLLLRIFRDYCCDGIYAMKNILLSMYDQMRTGPSPSSPGPNPSAPFVNQTHINMPREITVPVKVKLETIEEIKRTRTEDITRSLNLSASKLTDIARFETNKQVNETVSRNLNFLSNPTKAETPTERQKYMNIRTELFNRAIKDDPIARQVLSATSTSTVERIQKKEELLKTTPAPASITQIVSEKVQVPKEKVSTISNSFVTSITNNNTIVSTLSQTTNTTPAQVQTILSSYKEHISVPPVQAFETIVKETGIAREKVASVMKGIHNLTSIKINQQFITNIITNTSVANTVAQEVGVNADELKKIVSAFKEYTAASPQLVTAIAEKTGSTKETIMKVLKHIITVPTEYKEVAKQVAQKENIAEDDVLNVLQAQMPLVAQPEKTIEQSIPLPSTVSIEDYEEVKKMWTQQYEKGEVPVTENIKSRDEWLDQDIIFITNTLNKLLSPDPKIRQEGIDELSYILPIFILNNMKGNELLVYLKAKLEAAKAVKESAEKEKELTEKLKRKDDEDLVEVEKPQTQEAQKEQQLTQEMEVPQDQRTSPQETPKAPNEKETNGV